MQQMWRCPRKATNSAAASVIDQVRQQWGCPMSTIPWTHSVTNINNFCLALLPQGLALPFSERQVRVAWEGVVNGTNTVPKQTARGQHLLYRHQATSASTIGTLHNTKRASHTQGGKGASSTCIMKFTSIHGHNIRKRLTGQDVDRNTS